jgi:hypothetical protein
VLRAVFVPDGESPPPEFLSIDPMILSVTRDPATGEVTGGDAGVSLDGDIGAEWVPDDAEASLGDEGDDESTQQSQSDDLDIGG